MLMVLLIVWLWIRRVDSKLMILRVTGRSPYGLSVAYPPLFTPGIVSFC